MSGPTMMPTMCVPEKLRKQELVEQYRYMEDAMLRQGQQLHDMSGKLAEMCGWANCLASQLYALVDSYDANDTAAIAVQLKAMSDRRKSFVKARVH